MFYTKCSYLGEKMNGRMEGRGKFTFANGNRYIGFFKDGVFHGQGTIYFTAENGGGKFTALWKDGIAQEGTYLFSDGLEYSPASWEYCTPADRRFWREHNAFIAPPAAGDVASTIIPDYSSHGEIARHYLSEEKVMDIPEDDDQLDVGRGAAFQVNFADLPSSVMANQPFSVRVEVQDAFDDPVASAEREVHLKLNSGEGDLKVLDTPATTRNGAYVFEKVTYLVYTEGTFTLCAFSEGLQTARSPVIRVTLPDAFGGMQPARLGISGVPKTVFRDSEFSVMVQVLDTLGRVVNTPDSTFEVSIALASGKGNLGGKKTLVTEHGQAIFYDLTYDELEPFSLKATSPCLEAAETPELIYSVRGSTYAPSKLSFAELPQGTVPRGHPFTVAVVVQDAQGHVCAQADNMVDLQLATGQGGLRVGSAPQRCQGGYARFEDVIYDGDDPFTLVAVSDGLDSTPITEGLQPRAVPQRVELLVVKPELSADGKEFWTVAGAVVDGCGNQVKDYDKPVEVVLITGDGVLDGKCQAIPTGGVVEFSEVRFHGTGPFTLALSSEGLASGAPSDLLFPQAEEPMEEAPAAEPDEEAETSADDGPVPFRVALVELPVDQKAPFALRVEVQDEQGARCPTAKNVVTLKVSKGDGELSGCTTAAAVGGGGVFEGLRYSLNEPFYLEAVSEGLEGDATRRAIRIKPDSPRPAAEDGASPEDSGDSGAAQESSGLARRRPSSAPHSTLSVEPVEVAARPKSANDIPVGSGSPPEAEAQPTDGSSEEAGAQPEVPAGDSPSG
eukprot:RCo045912